jgi:hypothetical protein
MGGRKQRGTKTIFSMNAAVKENPELHKVRG